MDVKVVLRFITETGEIFSITVPYAKNGMPDMLVQDCMEQLIMLNAFSSSRGELSGLKDAKSIVTETTSIPMS